MYLCECLVYYDLQLDSLLVNPFRAVSQSMGQTVRTLPDNLISTVDGVMDGLNKVLQYSGVKGQFRQDSCDGEAIKVGASLDIEVNLIFIYEISLLLSKIHLYLFIKENTCCCQQLK